MSTQTIRWDDIYESVIKSGAIQTRRKYTEFIIQGIPSNDFVNLRNTLCLEGVSFDFNGLKVIVKENATFSIMHTPNREVITLTFMDGCMCAQSVRKRTVSQPVENYAGV